MEPTYTQSQLGDLIGFVLAGLRPGSVDDTIYTLEEVAERTHWALDTLQADCAAEPPRVVHTRRGRRIGMTSSQIAEEIRRRTVGVPFDERLAELVQSGAGQVRPGNRRRARDA